MKQSLRRVALAYVIDIHGIVRIGRRADQAIRADRSDGVEDINTRGGLLRRPVQLIYNQLSIYKLSAT